jgi:hypothetical protein
LIRAEGQHFKAARGFCLKQSCGFPAALINTATTGCHELARQIEPLASQGD